MAFCSNCGKEIENGASRCSNCGYMTESRAANTSSYDASSFGYAFLGFLFPIVGLVLYLVWKSNYPLRAASAGKGALISVIVSVAIYAIYFFVLFAGIASLGVM